jgi:hypothetical protein
MFIGHYGVGLAAKKLDNRPSLGTLFFASQFIDLLWPIFLLLGLEKVAIDPGNTAFTPLNFIYYPFSHGLVSVLIWAVLFGGVYYAFRKNIKTSLLLGGLVLSHWILDLFTHRPDLPLFFGNHLKVGLGLWNSVILSILVEGSIFIIGAYLYFKATKAENKKGQIGLWSLLIFLGIVYVMNVFGPPPPSVEPIAIVGLFQWLIVAWAYWIDRNRESVSPRIGLA